MDTSRFRRASSKTIVFSCALANLKCSIDTDIRIVHLYPPPYGGCGEGVNAPDCDSGIRGFKSHQPPHLFSKTRLFGSSLFVVGHSPNPFRYKPSVTSTDNFGLFTFRGGSKLDLIALWVEHRTVKFNVICKNPIDIKIAKI